MMKSLIAGGCLLALSTVCCAEESVSKAAIGKPAPDITLTGIDGKEFQLSDVTHSGKHVALMFSRAHW